MQLEEPSKLQESARHLTLEGCLNFRDLGGYPGAGGRTMRWRRLFRADSLARLTDADLGVVAGLGLATVIDLRTPDEVETRGRFDQTGAGYHHLPMIEVLPDRDEYVGWVRPEVVAEHYARMVAEAGGTIAAALELLFDERSYPAVLHCAAGKDRTGVLSALVLSLAGVSDDDIGADYALSALAGPAMLERLRRDYPDAVADIDSYAPAILAAEPETMRAFLSLLRTEHGSVSDYAASIGLDDAGERLRAVLLD